MTLPQILLQKNIKMKKGKEKKKKEVDKKENMA